MKPKVRTREEIISSWKEFHDGEPPEDYIEFDMDLDQEEQAQYEYDKYWSKVFEENK